MDKAVVIEKTVSYVKSLLEGEGTGHDWWHIVRVRNMALRLAGETPDADVFLVEMGALLHDVGDHKFHKGDATIGPKMVREFLEKLPVQEKWIAILENMVRDISYKGAGVATPMKTIEGKIVQDADRLDALGAIGIARTFAYGGKQNRLLYHPDIKPVMHSDFETYKGSDAPSINHFYEKLLLLKERMNTKAGRAIAQNRHSYMEQFLATFYREWEGEI